MPKGPKGEKRPADTVSAAVKIGRIATGEQTDPLPGKRSAGGKAGGKARAEKLDSARRSEIASTAAGSRWNQNKKVD
jgi:hypothetical protein